MAKEDSESAANTFSALRKTKREPSHQEARVVQTAQGIADTTYNLSEIVHHATPEQAFRKENDRVQISKETQTLLARTMVKMYQSFEPLKLTAVPVVGLTGADLQNAYAQNAIVDFVKNFADAAKLEEGAAATPVDLRTEAGLTDHAIYLLTTSPHKAQWLMTAFTLSQWEQMTLQMALRAELQYVSKYPKEIDNTRSVGVTTSQGSSQHEFGFSDIRLGRNMVPMTFEALKTAKMKLGKTKYGGYLFGKSDAQSRQVIFYEPDRSTYLADKSNVKIDYSNPNLNDTQRRFLLQHFRGTLIDPNNLRDGATFSDIPVGGSPKDPGGIKQREIDHLLQLAAARDEVYRMTGVNIGQAPDLIQRTGAVFGRGSQATDTLAFRHESFEPGSKNVVSIEQQANAAMTGVKTKLDELREQKKATGAVTSAKSVIDSRLAQREVKWKKVNDKDEIVEEAEQHDQFDIDYALSESDLKARTKLEQELQQLKERKGYAEEKAKLVADRQDKLDRIAVILDYYKNDQHFQDERSRQLADQEEKKKNIEDEIKRKTNLIAFYENKKTAPTTKSPGGQILDVYVQPLHNAIQEREELYKILVVANDEIKRLNNPIKEDDIPEAKDLKSQISDITTRLMKLDSEYGDVQPNPTASSTPLRRLRAVKDYELAIAAKEKEIIEIGPDAYWKEYKRGAYQSAQTLFTGERQLDIINAAKKLETADDKAAIVKAMLDVRDPRYKDYPPAYLVTLQMLYGDDIIGPGRFEEFNKAVALLPPDKWLDVVGPALSIPRGDIFHTNSALFSNTSAEHIDYKSIRSVLDALVTELKTSDRFGLPDESVELWCEAMREVAYAELDLTQHPFRQIIEGLLKNPDLYYFINEQHLAVIIYFISRRPGFTPQLSAEEAKTLAGEYMRRKKATGIVKLNKMPPPSPSAGASAPVSSPPPVAPSSPGAAVTPPGTRSPSASPTAPLPAAPSPSPSGASPAGGSLSTPELLTDLTTVRSGVESRGPLGSPADMMDVTLNIPSRQLYAVFDGGRVGDKAKETADLVADAIQEQDAAAGVIDPSTTPFDEYMEGLMQRSKTEVDSMPDHGVVAGAVVKLFETAAGIQAGIVNAGDCRVYLYRGGKLEQVTEDHYFDETKDMDTIKDRIKQIAAANSYTIDPAEVDVLTPDEIKRKLETFNTVSTDADFGADTIGRTLFKLKDELQFGIGSTDLALSTRVLPVNKGDRLLITTDGVHDNLSLNELESYMVASSATAATARLIIEQAQVRAGTKGIRNRKDDTSAVVVAV